MKKSLSKKKNKPKLKFGDYLIQNASPIGQAGNLAGGVIDSIAPEGSMAGGIASNALKGASSLAALGPIGMGVGAVAGGVIGSIQAKKAKEAEEAQVFGENVSAARQNLLGQGMNKGGKLKSKLNVVQGGELQSVSPDAVEVQANNPNSTDSVELDQAFVDNGEIIDNKDRVFSDDLISSTGKSYAKEAKRNETMKGKSRRFDNINKLLDKRNDDLFQEQEASKARDTKGRFAKGGKLKPSYAFSGEDPEFPGLPKTSFAPTGQDFMKQIMENPIRNNPGLQGLEDSIQGTFAGLKNKAPQAFANTSQALSDQTAALGSPDQTGTPINWNKALTGAATFVPNMVSGLLQKRLKGPASPQLQAKVTLDRATADPSIAESARLYRGASKTFKNNIGQTSALMSAHGNLFSKKLAADNQAVAQADEANTGIQAHEARLNTLIDSHNTHNTNQYKSDKVDFANSKKVMTSNNVANLGKKILQQGAEKNMMNRDAQALQYVQHQFGDSQVLARLEESDPVLAASVKKSLGMRKGGKLPAIKLNKKKSK